MSSHQDDHHASEQKPVSFTVPLILAAVLVFIMVLFLSLCDPKPHDAHGNGHDDHGAAVEASHNGEAEHEGHSHEAAASQTNAEPTSAETSVPAAEATH